MSRMRSSRSSTYSIALSGVAGLSDTPARLPERADRLQRAVEMRAGLGMHGDDVGARFGERREVGIGRRDHQMAVEDLRRRAADRLDDRRPEGDVRHEMPIHHVEMDPVGARGVDGAHLFAEAREVGGQDRGGDDQRPGGHGQRSLFTGGDGVSGFGVHVRPPSGKRALSPSRPTRRRCGVYAR